MTTMTTAAITTMGADKAAWTLLALAGVAATCRTLGEAVGRRRRLHAAGRNGPLRVLAWQAVRGEATTLLVQLLLAGLTAAAWHFPEPLLRDARRYYVACGWACAACSALLAIDSLLDLRDRRRLYRKLAEAEGREPRAERRGK